MIDTENEDIFLLSRGPSRLRSRPSIATLWRWAMRGVRGVQLETIVIGGRRYTSIEAFERFTHALNAAGASNAGQSSRRRASQRAEAARRASTLF